MNLIREYVREQLILEDQILQENVFKKAASRLKEKGKRLIGRNSRIHWFLKLFLITIKTLIRVLEILKL